MSKSLLAQQSGGALAAYADASHLDAVESSSSVPYVGWSPMKGDKMSDFKALGIAPGEPYLSRDGGVEHLDPFRFLLLDAFQCWASTDSSYNTLSVVTSKPTGRTDPHKELIETLILVVLDDEIVPALATFRGPKSTAAKTAIDTLKAASQAEWGKRSDAHKATMKLPYPFARFASTVSLRRRTSKSTGEHYVEAKATTAPTDGSLISLMGDTFSNPDFDAALTSVKTVFESKVGDLKGLIS